MTTQAPVPTPPSSYGPSPFPSPKVLVSPSSPGDCSHPLQTLSSLVQALTEPPPLNLLPLDSDCKYLHTQPTPAPVLQPPRTDSRRRRQNRHREIHRRRGRGRARSRQIDGKKKKKNGATEIPEEERTATEMDPQTQAGQERRGGQWGCMSCPGWRA